VPTADLLAKTVTSVFGDSAMLVADSTEPEFDIDVRSYEAHSRVMHYVQQFSGTARERMEQRLSRGTRYEPMIRAKLSAAGLPEDLTYLALIESGYDPHAYSRAAAVGMWQFMTATAKDVGMRVDWWMDERRDPARATDGAIRFLGYLQRQFGSLYLAAAAYNGGPGRVARGLTRFAEEMEGAEGEDRFFALADQDYLHSETKNYVPQLIAAAIVGKSPARYGMSIDTLAPYAYDSLRAPPGTSLAAVSAASGATVAELRSLNPAILRGVTPPDAAVYVRIPVGSAERASSELEAMSSSLRMGYTSLKTNGKQSLATIAKDAGISTTQLRWFNPSLKTSKKTGRPLSGQTMRIPKADALTFAMDVPDPKIEKYATTTAASSKASSIHVVRSGESLSTIGRRYGISVARLKSINRMKGDRIVAGQTIRVRSTTATSSTSKARATAKKSVKKPTVKNATASKSTAKKAPVKKASASTSTAKKTTTVKKTPAKKPTAKKTVAKQ
jgi:membrane-bound lytic murein transglycosylase D